MYGGPCYSDRRMSAVLGRLDELLEDLRVQLDEDKLVKAAIEKLVKKHGKEWWWKKCSHKKDEKGRSCLHVKISPRTPKAHVKTLGKKCDGFPITTERYC